MEWTRSETLALAAHSCVHCDGLGLRVCEKDEPPQPCNCVLRSIFRACHIRFRECAAKEKYMTRVTLDSVYGIDSRNAYSRKNEEYVADFCLVSSRFLTPAEHTVFRYHFLLGADWKLCCRRLKIDRGTFFHAVYRIQQRLGRAFRELEPYSLYPLSEYFSGEPKPVTPTRYADRKVVPIRPPVARPPAGLPTRKSA
jgi:hypothetical protein